LLDLFWRDVEEVVKFSKPLVRVLRIVNCRKSVMGYLYETMDRAKEAIRATYARNENNYMPLWVILNNG
jgi:hypothetical protein